MSYHPSHGGGTALSSSQLPIPVQVLSLAPRNTPLGLPPHKPLLNQPAQSDTVTKFPALPAEPGHCPSPWVSHTGGVKVVPMRATIAAATLGL